MSDQEKLELIAATAMLKKLKVSEKDIAGFFSMKVVVYHNSTAKPRYKIALFRFVQFLNEHRAPE